MRIDGGHVSTTATDGTTNYTAPTAITTSNATTNLTWTSFLGFTSATGPNGDTTSVGYDAAGRPSYSTSPYGATTTYAYSTSSPVTTATITSSDPTSSGRWTRTTMDGLGRTIKTESADSTGTVQSVVDYVYAACGCSPPGKLKQQSRPRAPNGTVYWTTYTYDGLGRTTSVVAPDGASTTTYSYAGNTVTVTDPAGKTKTFTMDAFGNLSKVVEPDADSDEENRSFRADDDQTPAKLNPSGGGHARSILNSLTAYSPPAAQHVTVARSSPATNS